MSQEGDPQRPVPSTAVDRRPLLIVGLTAVAMAVAFAIKARCGFPPAPVDQYLGLCYSDIPPLFYAERLHEGALPYLDHPVEYPVLIGAVMWLAAALPGDAVAFFLWTVLLLAGAGLATAYLLEVEVGWRRALAFAVAPTLLLSGVVNWDLLAMLLATAGLVAHRRGRDAASGLWIGLGTAAKLYPVLFLPGIVAAAWRLRGRAAGLTTALVAAVTWWAVNLPVALAAPDGWLEFLRNNRERAADWDSLWRIVPGWFGSPIDTGLVNAASLLVFAAGAVTLFAVVLRRWEPHQWHLLALPVLAWFLLANKVYSPQFSLWLLPLLALAFPGWWWWLAFAAADVMVTVTRFPYLANFVPEAESSAWPAWPFELAVSIRAALLVALIVVVLRGRERLDEPSDHAAASVAST